MILSRIHLAIVCLCDSSILFSVSGFSVSQMCLNDVIKTRVWTHTHTQCIEQMYFDHGGT